MIITFPAPCKKCGKELGQVSDFVINGDEEIICGPCVEKIKWPDLSNHTNFPRSDVPLELSGCR